MIIKLAGMYLIWSNVVDAPVTSGMSLNQFRSFYEDEYGLQGMLELDRRMQRVNAKGTSDMRDSNVDESIRFNRAGPNESILHREEIIEFYVRRGCDPTQEALDEFRQGLSRCGPACPQISGTEWCNQCWGTDYVR